MMAGIGRIFDPCQSLTMAYHSGASTGLLLTPLRARTAHIMQLGSIGIENRLLQSAPNLDHRHQVGRCEEHVGGQLGRAKNRDCSAAHGDHLTWSWSSALNFECKEPSEQ